MKLYEGLDQVPAPLPYPVITIGAFDGVHLGHRFIFHRVVERARELEGTSVAVTFSPPPRQVLNPDASPELLTTFPQKCALLERTGLDAVLVIPFSRGFARTPPEEFVAEILHRRMGSKELFVGHDFAFGRDRKGTIEVLKAEAERLGIAVTVVGPVAAGGEPVSSSAIREALRIGDPQRAAELLGRPFSLAGVVVEGYQEGRDMGFPTANVRVGEEMLMPADGVYAIQARWRGTWYDGVANVGTSPTFPDRPRRVEVHLFDVAATLYDEVLEVAFLERLRQERRFPSAEALREQIRKDAEQARALLANLPPATDREVST